MHRDTLRKLAAESAIPSEQDGPNCKLYFRRSDLDAWRRTVDGRRHLATTLPRVGRRCHGGATTAARVRVERNIYRRNSGVFEVGFKDGSGRQRWRTVEGGITAARAVRDELLSRVLAASGSPTTVAFDSATLPHIGSMVRWSTFGRPRRAAIATRLSSICCPVRLVAV